MKFIILTLLVFSLQAKEFTSLGMKLKFEYLKIDESSPIWGLDFIDKNRVIYTTQKGEIFIYNNLTKKKDQLIHDIKNIKFKGQGGLLDIINFKDNIYVTFSESTSDGSRTSLAKAKFNDKKLNFKVIFTSKSESNNNNHHYGSRILIHNDSLFLTIGDRGERDKAQDLSFHNGKVINISLEGETLKSNSPIYSLGHRNPQGIAIFEGKIFNGEFGPQGGDEINLLKAGSNYGWPKVTFGEEYGGGKIGKSKGYTMPSIYWHPSLSFSGINFYTGNKISKWSGHLFLSCLGTNHLRRVDINNPKDQEVLLKDLSERFRMVRMSPDEKVYISFDSGKMGVISN